jgi:hypothetical protein
MNGLIPLKQKQSHRINRKPESRGPLVPADKKPHGLGIKKSNTIHSILWRKTGKAWAPLLKDEVLP